MDRQINTKALFLAVCPRLNRGFTLTTQTWEEHIKPFHPLEDHHLPVIKQIIENCDEQQPVWYKSREPTRLCIVKQMPLFLPANKFLLIALLIYSERTGCVTSVYPVDELPSTKEGYKLL